MTEKVRNCDRCGKTFVEPYKEYLCRDCLDDLGWNATYNTNADHIRAMTDEELANFIPNWGYTAACDCGECYVDCNGECEKCVAEWLKQPWKENT